jgi:hypothetical protein
MSIDAVSSVHSDQARAVSAALRVAVALEHDRHGSHASPAEIERGHAAVQAARVALAQADAAVKADQAVSATGGVVV